MSKVKLYETDYVLVNRVTQAPLEEVDIIYHYKSLIEVLNDMLYEQGCEYISMKELDDDYKSIYLKHIKELYKIIKD